MAFGARRVGRGIGRAMMRAAQESQRKKREEREKRDAARPIADKKDAGPND